MEEDIDEVLLRLTHKPVMCDKSNSKYNLTSTNNVLDLESENDDCCTSVSQRPVNPLSVLGTSASTSLLLPTVKMVTYDRFWQGQVESVANDNKEDFTELSSSVGTFSNESKNKHPVIFSEWCPILYNKKLHITGVTIVGSVDSRSINRRISGYIFYDDSEVPCSLGGPMTHLNSQPKFIQHKFACGIPEDWAQVQSSWNSFVKRGSPENFPWFSSTELDTSDADLTITGYDQSIMPSTKLAISTPRNHTTDFYNMTTDISKINAADGSRNYPQKLFHNTVNTTVNRSMKKTYTSASLKKKLNKIQSLLKVTLMRELTSVNELVDLQENNVNMSTCNVEVPVGNGVPTIASDSNNGYLVQNKLPDRLGITDLSKNNVNVPTTSQSKIIELVNPENSLHKKVAINNNNNNNSGHSSKTASNVFLNKSQFLTKKNKTTTANVSQKFHEYVSEKDNLLSKKSALCVSENQSSKPNSAVSKVCGTNNSKTSSTDELRNYVPSHIFRKHRNSLTLLLNKNGVEHKSVSCNSSEVDSLDLYPTNSDSVVISFHDDDSNQIDVTSNVNIAHTAKNSSLSRSLKNSITENTHNDKVIQSEEHHLESSSEDSIFSRKSKKKKENTNKSKFNASINEMSVNKDNQDSNQTMKVISNQNSYQINKVTGNVDMPYCNKSLNNKVHNRKVIRNKILFSSESSDDDDDQNANQINKAANTNVGIPNSVQHLNLATRIIEERLNTSNSESSDDGRVNSILVNQTITQSSNGKSKFGSESSDNNETQESHVKIVTNALVHSVSPTLQEPQNSNKSGIRMNRKAICEKSNEMYTNDNLEIISRVAELTDDKSANRSNSKIKSPEKRNRDNSPLERIGKKKIKGNKSHEEDKATNETIMPEDSLMQFTEEIIQEQSLPEPKQTPKSSKGRNNAKREKDTIQSISTYLALESDVSLNNTTFSRKGRARCPTLPFWTGARFVTIGDETMVTQVSALNSSNKAIENKKRLLTPQKQTSVAKKARTKTPQKSPVKVLNTERTVLSPVAETEQQNKNIANVRIRTPKNTKNLCSTSENNTEESCIKMDPVKPARSASKKNIKKLLPDENASAKYSPKSRKAKKTTVSLTNTTTNVDGDTNISIIEENEKRVFSPIKLKTKDINQNSPLQREANTNIKVVDDVCFIPIKSNKKMKMSSKDSRVEINNTNYTDELMEYESIPIDNRNAKLNNNTTLEIANTNTEININNVEPTVVINNGTVQEETVNLQTGIRRNKNKIDGRSISSKKRNAKTEEGNRRTRNGNIKSSTLKTNNHTRDTTSNVNLIKHETKNRRNKKSGEKHEINVQDVTTKQLRSRGISFEIINNVPKSHRSSCITDLKPQPSVETSTKKSTPKPTKSPKKLTETSKRETHEIIVPTLSPKKSRKTRDSNKRQLPSDSVCLLSSKPKKNRNRGSKKSKNDDNSVEQSIVTKSNTNKRITLKNNEENSSNELAISKEPVKKSKRLKQSTTQDKNLTVTNADFVSSIVPNRPKRSRKYNVTDGGINDDFSGSNSQKTGKHKKNSTQTVDQLSDTYVNNKCVALVTPLTTEEIEKYTKNKSPEPLVQSTMTDQKSGSVNQTINGKPSRVVEKNVSSSSKAKSRSSSFKKPRKQKSFGETYFGDPVRMPLLIKLKRKRQPKEEQSINTTDLAANSSNKSINSTNNVTQKSGKRKLFNELEWMNSQECLQTFAEIVEPQRPQNFCLQFEENKIEHDYFDDDVISEVSALAKV